MIDLVVVSKGSSPTFIKMTQQCLDSFRWGKKVVLEETTATYHDATTIKQPIPFNYNHCLNEGLKHCEAEWVCFSNNDVEFLDGFEKIISYPYESMSPKNPIWGRHKDIDGVQEGYNVGLELCGWCIVAKKEMIERIGGFPEDVSFWCSDNLYGDVLIHLGIIHALIGDCHAIHNPSRTLFSSPNLGNLTHGQAVIYNEVKKKWKS